VAALSASAHHRAARSRFGRRSEAPPRRAQFRVPWKRGSLNGCRTREALVLPHGRINASRAVANVPLAVICGNTEPGVAAAIAISERVYLQLVPDAQDDDRVAMDAYFGTAVPPHQRPYQRSRGARSRALEPKLTDHSMFYGTEGHRFESCRARRPQSRDPGGSGRLALTRAAGGCRPRST
jgi:hypothetical protein